MNIDEGVRLENEALREERDRLIARKEQVEMQMAAAREEASRQVMTLQGHKNTLAGEVFKLREEKAQLLAMTSGSIAKADGTLGKEDPLRAEAVHVLKQQMIGAQEEKEQMMEYGHRDKVLAAKQIKLLREEVADAQNEERRLQAAVDQGAHMPASGAAMPERDRVAAAISEKDSLDRLFLEQATEMRQNLRASTLNRLAQGNQQLTIHQLIAISNDQIHRIVNQASNLKTDKLIHKEFVNLLHENGSIRRTLNEYAEGLLRDPALGSQAAQVDTRPYLSRQDHGSKDHAPIKPNVRTCGGLFA